MVATWTYIDNSAPNKECQISIWRYGTAEAAKNANLLKRSFLAPGWVEISAAKDSDLTYTDPGFRYRMFWTMIPAKPDNNFLVVVEGSMTNADINARVANPIIKQVLDPNLPLADNTTIQDVNIQPGPYKVDSTFTITVLVSIPIPIKIASFNVPLTPPSHLLRQNPGGEATRPKALKE